MEIPKIMNFTEFNRINEDVTAGGSTTPTETPEPSTPPTETPETTETTTLPPKPAETEFYTGFKTAVETGNAQVKDVDDTTKEYSANGATYQLKKVQ